MDPYPLVPENEEIHDVLHVLSEACQEIECNPRFPLNCADNLTKYNLDEDSKLLETSALCVEKYYEANILAVDDIHDVEVEIMRKQAIKMIEYDELKNYPCLIEALKLKRTKIFKELTDRYKNYALIQADDLLPHRIEQILDFRINHSLHTCKKCFQDEHRTICDEHQDESESSSDQNREDEDQKRFVDVGFVAEPPIIEFYNYEIGDILKKKFKIRNIMNTIQSFSYSNFPAKSPLDLKLITKSTRLAPGMFAEFLVTYSPTEYLNENQSILFKFQHNKDLLVFVKTIRDAPKLLCYIYNPKCYEIMKPTPSLRNFSFRRCAALNFTIDCGTCLLGAHTVLIMAMKNDGPKGRFFITTESEWFFAEIQGQETRSFELHQGDFSIFPTYFCIDRDEIVEVVILFMPEYEGLSAEKLLIICDNNSYQEIEVLGDCITFNPKDITVNLFLGEGLVVEHSRKVKFHTQPSETISFIMSVSNNSSLNLNYHWSCISHIDNTLGTTKILDEDMIKVVQRSRCLPCYGVTDSRVEITPGNDASGHYVTTVNLFIENIPIFSIPADLQFRIVGDESHNRECSCISDTHLGPEDDSSGEICTQEERLLRLNEKCADIHICELKVVCVVESEPDANKEAAKSTTLKSNEGLKAKSRIKFRHSYLTFGLLPKGIEVTKKIEIECLENTKLKWNISEVKIGCAPGELSDVTNDHNLDKNHGTFTKKFEKCSLTYRVKADECQKWLSLLVLSTCPPDEDLEDPGEIEATIESVCVTTYEVQKIDIKLYNEDNNLPLLCPKGIIYVEMPIYSSIFVRNDGLLTGCFCFLKPMGGDSDKIKIRFSPHSGVIEPGQHHRINVEIIASESGIFDDLFVPCFTGNVSELISLKILCVVNNIDVYFYLPDLDRQRFNKILWPPKNEGPNWNLIQQDGGEIQGESLFVTWGIPDYEQDLKELTSHNSVALTYPTVEMRGMRIRRPASMKFYIENLSPLKANFTVDATNFGCEEDPLKNGLVKANVKTRSQYWEKSCVENYGVVVEPDRFSGDIVGYEVVELNLTVYANTWGLFLEEIIVEIGDLTPFCFNLLIDVSGIPLEFPFSLNTICRNPTLRFGNVAYLSDPVTKSVKLVNVTSISLFVTWKISNRCDNFISVSMNEFHDNLEKERSPENFDFGSIVDCEHNLKKTQYIKISKNNFWLDAQKTTFLDITLDLKKIPLRFSKTNLIFDLVGEVDIKSEDSYKDNYFKREKNTRVENIFLEVQAKIEMPILKLDLINEETTIIRHVNDFLLEKMSDPEIYLIFRNNDYATVFCSIETEKPFIIKRIKTEAVCDLNKKLIEVKRGGFLEVQISAMLTYEDYINFSEFVYPEIKKHEDDVIIPFNPLKADLTCSISKHLYIEQIGAPQQRIPLNITLHYPRIEVKPDFLKFGRVLIFNTKRKYLTITNPTGGLVMIEIYKNFTNDTFVINPSFGTIQKSTGVNKQFIDIAVYFTPRESTNYQETLRIFTNFPRYYIDVPLSGHGSNNEKFYVA